MEPLVSVIIPFYSGVEWLCEAVQSVLDQTYKNFEIIVVNDGSPEDVTAFLERYGDKIVYFKKENGGLNVKQFKTAVLRCGAKKGNAYAA